MSYIWQVLTCCCLRPQQWVFAQYVQNGSNDEIEILFRFLRYWGLQHNWNMYNAFMFDNRHGVKAYIKKLKDILVRNVWMLEHVGIVSSNAYIRFFDSITGRPFPCIGI